jgi:hypothetical protein
MASALVDATFKPIAVTVPRKRTLTPIPLSPSYNGVCVAEADASVSG